MSNHNDIVLRSNTDDRIGLDSQGRIRVDCDGNRSCKYSRTTTGSSLSNSNSVVVNCNITVNGDRRISVSSTRSIRDDFTVTIPSEDLTTRNTTGNVSSQSELSTFAEDITISKVSCDGIDNRIVINRNIESSAGSSTARGQLINLEGVAVVTIGRSNSVAQ